MNRTDYRPTTPAIEVIRDADLRARITGETHVVIDDYGTLRAVAALDAVGWEWLEVVTPRARREMGGGCA